jgi:hypothetical protein
MAFLKMRLFSIGYLKCDIVKLNRGSTMPRKKHSRTMALSLLSAVALLSGILPPCRDGNYDLLSANNRPDAMVDNLYLA